MTDRVGMKVLRGAGAVLLLGMLAGCGQYLDRRETVSLGAGDSHARNRWIFARDPWPREAFDRHIHTNGEKLEGAMQRYVKGKSAAGPAAQTLNASPSTSTH